MSLQSPGFSTPPPSIRRLGTSDVKQVCSPWRHLVRSQSFLVVVRVRHTTLVKKITVYLASEDIRLPRRVIIWPLKVIMGTNGTIQMVKLVNTTSK